VGWKVELRTEVAVGDGVTRWFRVPDVAMLKFMREGMRARRDVQGGGIVDTADLPAELLAAMLELFTSGVVDWAGVTDEAGAPLACTPEAREAVPMELKIEAVSAYLERRNVLEGNG
jgi:hypothetical protein